MAYKLKQSAPKELTDLFNPNLLDYVIFKNEVPLYKINKEHFAEITEPEYETGKELLHRALNGLDNEIC